MLCKEDLLQAVQNTPVEKRVSSQVLNGKKIWIKRPEQVISWKDRYKKWVNPSFQHEVSSLRFLNQANAPAPKVLLFGDDFVVTEDSGKTVQDVLKDQPQTTPESEKKDILFKTGAALATLHSLDLAHGRPALRDICWNGYSVQFIDFERSSTKQATLWQKKQDIMIFVHDLLLRLHHSPASIHQTLNGYISKDEQNNLKITVNTARKLRLALPFLQLIKPIAGRDVGVAIQTLKLLSQRA